MKLNIHNEKEILYKASKGDQRAFTLLFDTYYQNLGAYIYTITESVTVTEEIVQEVFIKIWEKREMLEEIDSFKAYLFVLSKNRTVDYLRVMAKERIRQLSIMQAMKEDSYDTDHASLAEEYHVIIDQAVAKLPPQQQRVYNLSRHENLKYEEIAVHLGISKETVKKHMQLALAFLKQQVKVKIENIGLGVLFVAFLYAL